MKYVSRQFTWRLASWLSPPWDKSASVCDFTVRIFDFF